MINKRLITPDMQSESMVDLQELFWHCISATQDSSHYLTKSFSIGRYISNKRLTVRFDNFWGKLNAKPAWYLARVQANNLREANI